MSLDLARLLDDAAEAGECRAPEIDPVRELRSRQALTRDRRRHLVTVAFVAFVLLVQVVPRPALGADTVRATAAAGTEQMDVSARRG